MIGILSLLCLGGSQYNDTDDDCDTQGCDSDDTGLLPGDSSGEDDTEGGSNPPLWTLERLLGVIFAGAIVIGLIVVMVIVQTVNGVPSGPMPEGDGLFLSARPGTPQGSPARDKGLEEPLSTDAEVT